ncbi:MAG: helix-turn-helix transcriptional regulator [Ferruginibacter sp.]
MSEFRLKENLKWLYKNSDHKSQEQFARQFGITRGMFESYLRGAAEPTLKVAAEICREFGININQLLYTKLSIDLIRKTEEENLPMVAETETFIKNIDKHIEDKVSEILKKNKDVDAVRH